jgi:transposase-like protein
MTQNNIDLLNLLNQTQSEDFFKEVLKSALEKLMDMDVSNQINAQRNERSTDREAYRNGYRSRGLNTRVGEISLEVPKLRKGSYYPPFLHYYQRTEASLLSVVQESYIEGVSTRKMENLIQQMGIEGISKSQVSEICQNIKDEVDAFFSAPIIGQWPYIYLDALYIKVRQDKRVVSKAVIVAIGVNDDGIRRILGLVVADSEACIFWKQFLERLIDRGLQGVQLVISDAHKGLKEAINSVFLGASWQRCWVHFMRNILIHTSKKNSTEILDCMKSITAFKTPQSRQKRWQEVIEIFENKHPKIAELMAEAEEDVLAHTAFPEAHWNKIYSNNLIERLNREIKRRTNCVGIFPNDAAIIRLIGSILIRWDEHWLDSKPYFSQESMTFRRHDA